MRFSCHVAAASAALVLASVPAAAAIRIASYSGTLASGFDKNGLFGTLGADLAGLAIVAAYTFDTSLGNRNANPGSSDELTGGTTYGVATPVIRTRITINGISRDLPGLTGSTAFTGLGYGRTFETYDFEDTPAFQIANGAANIDLDAESALSFSLDQNVAPIAVVLDTSYFQFTNFDKINLVQSERTFGEWNANAIYALASVPEPANWALMIAGFGLIGIALRRQPAILPA